MTIINDNFLYRELSYQVIGICCKVHTKLGSCLPEHVYNHAIFMELSALGIPSTQQQSFPVYYNDCHIGQFYTDIIVDNKIILELKVDERITMHHESQLFTYLRASGLKVGYVINFGLKSIQFKRLIL